MIVVDSIGDTPVSFSCIQFGKQGETLGETESPLVVSPCILALACRRPKLDKLGVTGSIPVSPTPEGALTCLGSGPFLLPREDLTASSLLLMFSSRSSVKLPGIVPFCLSRTTGGAVIGESPGRRKQAGTFQVESRLWSGASASSSASHSVAISTLLKLRW